MSVGTPNCKCMCVSVSVSMCLSLCACARACYSVLSVSVSVPISGFLQPCRLSTTFDIASKSWPLCCAPDEWTWAAQYPHGQPSLEMRFTDTHAPLQGLSASEGTAPQHLRCESVVRTFWSSSRHSLPLVVGQGKTLVANRKMLRLCRLLS